MSTLNYERRGRGEPLVLIHGIGHRWQAWEPVLDRLARHHDVVAVDLPGFGQSPVPANGMPSSMRRLVTMVRRFLDELGLERPHVVGNSLGGGISLELANTGVVASATAIAPAGFFSPAEGRQGFGTLMLLRVGTFLPEPLLRLTARTRVTRDLTYGALMTRAWRLDEERLVGDALALRRAAGFLPLARAISHYEFRGRPRVPVTVAWGDRDRILPPHQAALARLRLPDAQHVVLPDCGHVPMSDSPELVSELILRTTHRIV